MDLTSTIKQENDDAWFLRSCSKLAALKQYTDRSASPFSCLCAYNNPCPKDSKIIDVISWQGRWMRVFEISCKQGVIFVKA